MLHQYPDNGWNVVFGLDAFLLSSSLYGAAAVGKGEKKYEGEMRNGNPERRTKVSPRRAQRRSRKRTTTAKQQRVGERDRRKTQVKHAGEKREKGGGGE